MEGADVDFKVGDVTIDPPAIVPLLIVDAGSLLLVVCIRAVVVVL